MMGRGVLNQVVLEGLSEEVAFIRNWNESDIMDHKSIRAKTLREEQACLFGGKEIKRPVK